MVLLSHSSTQRSRNKIWGFDMPSPSFCFGFLFLIAVMPTIAVCDDDAIERAVDDAEMYRLYCEEVLVEYYMEVDITAESSPDSALLFQSKGKMTRLQTKVGDLEFCNWDPEILADDRPPFLSIKVLGFPCGFQQMTVDGVTWLMEQDQFHAIDDAYRRNHSVDPARCIGLLDWPLHVESSFYRRIGKPNIASRAFAGKSKCFAAKMIDAETVESIWAVEPESNGIGITTFKAGLPVKVEGFAFKSLFAPSKGIPDVTKGLFAGKVETQWTKLPGNLEVPSLVHAIHCSNPHESSSFVELTARIKVYLEDTPEFKNKLKELETAKQKLGTQRAAKLKQPK